MTGPLGYDRVLDAYVGHDVLVLVSDTEGYPKVVAEAMAFGLVVIGADYGEFRQLLGDGAGVLVAPGDQNAVTCALQRLAADPDERQRMSRRASERASRASLSQLRVALERLLEARW